MTTFDSQQPSIAARGSAPAPTPAAGPALPNHSSSPRSSDGELRRAAPRRIGVLGGTFDPIHNVHLQMARAALEQANLDRVLFVVSARPPHKRARGCESPEHRYAMVEAALADQPRMEPSRIEIDREGPSYTAVTLQQLRDEHPDAELFLILGIDSLADLMRWRDPETILRLARLLVVPRPGVFRIPSELEGHYRLLDFPPAPVSSTDVRRRIADKEPLDSLLPPAVKQYILEKDLYDACP